MAETFESAAEQLALAKDAIPAVPVAEARTQARNARARVLADWPDDTGESARGFTVITDGTGARLFNDVRHAFYVGEGQAHRSIQKSIRDGDLPAITRIERATTNLLEG